ncbi:MAG: anti-sigma factor family protein [Hyphomicrobiaceae bacterium]
MMRLDEETLNAYADGALDTDARARVESHLKTDTAARELLAKLRRANMLAAQAFDAPMHEPVPQALIDTIRRRPDRNARRDATVRPQRRRFRPGSMRTYAMPLAAAFVLALGIGAGLFFARQPAQTLEQLPLGPVRAESQLHRLLESYPSGRFVEIDRESGHAGRLGVIATFRDRNGRACREVEVLPAGTDQQPLAAGVACRRTHGGWVMEGAARVAQAPSATGQDFEPSGVSEKDVLDGLLGMLGAQAALSPEEERALIQRGWTN